MPELGENLYLLNAVIGAILPWIIAQLTRVSWKTELKTIVAAAVCVIVGAVMTFVAGEWDRADITRSVLIVFFVSQVVYGTYFKPKEQAKKLQG